MKKIIAIIMTVCLMTGMLCIAAFATDDVLRVSGQKQDGTVVEIKSFSAFDDGWDYAMEYAADHNWLNDNDYSRVVVDLLTDWNAVDGKFTDDFWGGDKGFKWKTIRVYEEAIITLNLNGHTINRGLTDNEYNGEVIYVDENSDIIINNGTITGGNSDNGSGGIHIKDGATVTLNEVNIVNNIADGDDGGAIAMYGGSTLVMNGGSCVGNINDSFDYHYGAAVYVDESTATFNNVRFYDNQFTLRTGMGAAIYAKASTVTMDNCEVKGNGVWGKIGNGDGTGSYSTVCATNGTVFTIKNTTFKGNGSIEYNDDEDGDWRNLIEVKYSSQLFIEGCTFTENYAGYYVLDSASSDILVTDTTIMDNVGAVYMGGDAQFTKCTFGQNGGDASFKTWSNEALIVFKDCEMGDSTYGNINNVKFVDTDAPNGIGSIFGEGSMAMIVSLLALVASAVSICMTIVYNKKKTAPEAANNAAEAKDK